MKRIRIVLIMPVIWLNIIMLLCSCTAQIGVAKQTSEFGSTPSIPTGSTNSEKPSYETTGSILPSNSETKSSQNSNNEIIEEVFSQLPQASKAEIIDWQSAIVTYHDYSKEKSHSIMAFDSNKYISLDGKKVYRIEFESINSAILGNVRVYVDQKTLQIIGGDLRD